MDRTSPPLKQLRLLFQLGGGARLGSGEQFMPMISLRDWVGAVSYLIESRDVSGAFNLCCPRTPTNAEFTRALAAALHRKAFLAVPAPLMRMAAGDLAPELLGSVNARPTALERAGYDFEDEDVREVLSAALS
jgi:NAD dependent epimerase/dehydratase family enzyme